MNHRFHPSIRTDFVSVDAKAYDLLHSILPPALQMELENTGTIGVQGHHYNYVLSTSQTNIYFMNTLIGGMCIHPVRPLPRYDRMLAEYLMIRGDEERYLNTGNMLRLWPLH